MAEDPITLPGDPQPTTRIHGYTAIAERDLGRKLTKDEIEDWLNENDQRLMDIARKKRRTPDADETVYVRLEDWE